jgi:hypothetical protein
MVLYLKLFVCVIVLLSQVVCGTNSESRLGMKQNMPKKRNRLDIIPSSFPEKPWKKDLCHLSHVHVMRWVDSRIEHPSGIACRCDWVLVSTGHFNSSHGSFFRKNVNNMHPQIIFVGTRILSEFSYLIDYLPNKVVIVSGINDESYPLNFDSRFESSEFGQQRRLKQFYKIANHSKVIHWFIENLSMNHPKVSPIPIGFEHVLPSPQNPHPSSPDQLFKTLMAQDVKLSQWSSRKVMVLSIDKTRDGVGVWKDRRVAFDLCQKSIFCVTGHSLLKLKRLQSTEEGVIHQHSEFMQSVLQAKFTIMVHGGGIDPCPKLFEVLLLGSIPIIEKSHLSSAYELPHFPIAVVPSINKFLHPNNSNASLALLEQWTAELAPFFLNETLREQSLYHLTSDYWWGIVHNKYISNRRSGVN